MSLQGSALHGHSGLAVCGGCPEHVEARFHGDTSPPRQTISSALSLLIAAICTQSPQKAGENWWACENGFDLKDESRPGESRTQLCRCLIPDRRTICTRFPARLLDARWVLTSPVLNLGKPFCEPKMSSSICTCNMNVSLDIDLPKHSVDLARLAIPALSGEVLGRNPKDSDLMRSGLSVAFGLYWNAVVKKLFFELGKPIPAFLLGSFQPLSSFAIHLSPAGHASTFMGPGGEQNMLAKATVPPSVMLEH
ncbi:hypothetical protein Q9233_011246 [Columba guinea]|nr:hypothetical protein Q9233_011246 [Columba guinea]